VNDERKEHDNKSKANIFIFYSRKDATFVDRLQANLALHGFTPIIDRTDIYAFEEWWKRIEALIINADTVVFVISPDAVSSDIRQSTPECPSGESSGASSAS
jgi:hypothetical protein